MRLDELKIIVTGAASGMGKHFALRFAEAGARVVASDVNESALNALVQESSDLAGEVFAVPCDVSQEAQVVSLVDRAFKAMGGLNALVNNAGIFRDSLLVKKGKDGEVRKMSMDDWNAVIGVDLTGPFLCTREFAGKLLETDSKPGVVVNISSVSRHGNMGQSNYSAAKAGLVADTRLWGSELARYGIRVGAIAPGFIDTPILQGMRPEVLGKVLQGVPLRQAGQCEEIFLGAKFIIECDYFTGRCLDIDGGLNL